MARPKMDDLGTGLDRAGSDLRPWKIDENRHMPLRFGGG